MRANTRGHLWEKKKKILFIFKAIYYRVERVNLTVQLSDGHLRALANFRGRKKRRMGEKRMNLHPHPSHLAFTCLQALCVCNYCYSHGFIVHHSVHMNLFFFLHSLHCYNDEHTQVTIYEVRWISFFNQIHSQTNWVLAIIFTLICTSI